MPHQSSPVRVPVDLLRQFFGPERVSGEIGRLTVTWFLLSGGWEARLDDDRLQSLRNVKLASWLWPPSIWRLMPGRCGITTTSVLLELQSLGLAKVIGREGNDVLVELLRPPGGWLLPERIEAELEAIAKRQRPPSEDSSPEEAAE
jgi:hypothetical protein